MSRSICSSAPAKRVPCIEGLRGLAICLVVCYHFFAYRTNLLPFGDAFASLPIFKYGWVGVELFFLLSGFLIARGLPEFPCFGEYIRRRFLRLYPGLIFFTILIWATSALFPLRPNGQVVARDMLPGLTLIQPGVWLSVLGGSQGVTEKTLWSLFIEVKFYLMFGLLYFWRGLYQAIGALIGLYLLWVIFGVFFSEHFPVLKRLLRELGVEHFGWFACGALLNEYVSSRRFDRLVVYFLLGGISCWTVRGGVDLGAMFAGLCIVVLFFIVLISTRASRIFSAEWLRAIGFASYPLYLMHDQMGVSAIRQFAWSNPFGSFFVVALVMGILFFVAWFFARFIEPQLKSALDRCVRCVLIHARPVFGGR